MNTLKTTLVGALALGAMTVTFAGEALAGHQKGKGWNKGRGGKAVEVYVDAGANRALQRMVAENLERHNPNVDVVYARRYADVVVTVDGILSEPYRARGRQPVLAMDYDYKIRVRTGGRLIYKDHIRGRVSEPLGGRRYGYRYNSYSKGEIAHDVLGILVAVIVDRHGQRDAYGGRYRIEEELAFKAFSEVAYRAAHIKIPKRARRYR